MLACKNKTAKNLKLTVKITTTSTSNTEKKSSEASDQEMNEDKN